MTIFLKQLNDFYTHVCYDNVTEIYVKNDKNITIRISRRARLKILIKYEVEDCYQIDDIYHEMTMINNIKKKAWFQNETNDFMIFEFFHESEIRTWFQNVINNFTMFESFHDKFSDDFKNRIAAFESIHEKLNFSKSSHFFTIIREI